MPIDIPTRRSVMLATAGLAAGLTGLAAGAGSPVLASGTVFHDRSGRGARNAGDPGIEGVLVSNGCEVTCTDASGRWQLPALPGSLIFAIKPPHWSLSGNHPQTFARRVAIGSNANSAISVHDVDFGLVPKAEGRSFEAVLIADPQPASEQELGFLREGALTEIANTGAVFAINHGDVVFDNPALYAPFLQLTAATGIPWHHCPGNHDMNAIAEAGDNCFEIFEAVVGPAYYAFQYSSTVFLVLNNVERLAPGQLSAGGYDYRGAFGERQLQFVRNVLAHVPRDKLIVVSTHIPLVGFEDPSDPAGHTADVSRLMELLSGRPHTVSFAGHTHTTEHHYMGAEYGFRGPGMHHHHVLTTASGSWWSGPFDHRGLPLSLNRDGSPKGFHLLRVEGNRYTTELVPIGQPGHQLAAIAVTCGTSGLELPTDLVDSRNALVACTGRRDQLFVNVFDGGPRTRVRALLERASHASKPSYAIELMPKRSLDPIFVDHYRRNRTALKSWVEPTISSHLWSAPLPETLTPDIHRLTVLIVNEYGREQRLSALLEVRDNAMA